VRARSTHYAESSDRGALWPEERGHLPTIDIHDEAVHLARVARRQEQDGGGPLLRLSRVPEPDARLTLAARNAPPYR
jgi:hypothetical protein